MIHIIATKYRKGIAGFLLLLFYCQITLPVLAINHHSRYRIPRSIYSHTEYPLFSNNTSTPLSFSDHSAINKENGGGSKRATPGVAEIIDNDKEFIGGPGQPEMASFKSVNSDNLVDLFTGDFSYNIPLLDVGGYPVNIHYSSGISMDQEASWVGLGWNINPGTISRSMRGLPDDFNGKDTIAKTQNVKENRTVGVTVGADVEVFGAPINLGATTGIFHNTYNGWGQESGINASINVGSSTSGSLTSRLSISNNTQSGLNVSPSFGAKLGDLDKADNGRSVGLGLSTNYNSRSGISALQFNVDVNLQRKVSIQQREAVLGVGTSYPFAAISFATPSYTPSITMPFTSTNFTFRAKVGNELWGLHPSGTLEGYVSSQEIDEKDRKQSLPAVGYLYYTASANRNNVLLDFNREKELSFNPRTTPNIAIPQYTYDVYSISGEGTGGMFRPYRGDVGYMKDYTIRTKSDQGLFSLDVGFGNIFHGGIDIMKTESYTQNGEWSSANNLRKNIEFKQSDTTYEAVYFRNPGEKTSNAKAYQDMIGGDALMRVKLAGSGEGIRAESAFQTYKNGINATELTVNSGIAKKQRDKRSQVITHLTALEASNLGLDKKIISYRENIIPNGCSDDMTLIPRFDEKIRKAHHLSQINVLNGDGRRYVYGLPVYNLEQKDVTFSVDKETNDQNIQSGLVKYTPGQDNSVNNTKGKEGIFSQDSMPAYAHSFLLTGILSPDYVDVKDDGITEDDLGDAVKFNYTRIYGDADPFEWRTPFNRDTANYNEGFKTYSRDDKGSYIYGKKEIWYLNSIESKTMVAVFTIANDRKDIYAMDSENGGINNTRPLRRLTKIDLFAKADLLKNQTSAKPVKTVHFAYSYRLCKGIAGDPSTGKLTLDSIWFFYNKNEKGKLNPYVFRYHADDNKYNPGYHPRHYDRWGNYKPAQNPGGLSNADYPYAEQDSTKASVYAAAWTLSDIKLPSGGHMKITYESDDYGFVQNKRAAQFFKIAGVSFSQESTTGKFLYSRIGNKNEDYYYVHINSSVPLENTADIYQRFLEGMDYIYFRLSVKVPTDKWGSGYEFIPVYAKVDSYGLTNANQFWLKLKPVEGESPLARNAIQFLRLNLPSKAYPVSEPGDNIKFEDAVKMLASSFKEVENVLNGFGTAARNRDLCKEIDTSRSFVRLNNPIYKKYGGGLRVKRIEVFDNWKEMTNQRQAVYGQEYCYATSEKINGKEVLISSGVASYEPIIGGEENPFRIPVEYTERLAPMAPANNLFSEKPFGESYFPSAFVGYSKVRVRTMNAKAKSANGWQETEFFTSKEFPTIIENTVLDGDSKRTHNPRLRNFLKINSIHQVTVSQGFKIELNDMNGKLKAQSGYAENDSLHPISYVRNFYKVDNDSAYQKHLNNKVWVVDSLNGHVNVDGEIGKDIEVIMDMREQLSKTMSGNTSANVDIFQAGPFPAFTTTFFKLPQREENRFRSVASVKVIQRYGILDSIVAMDKGSIVSTKNLLYDGESGEVVLSRTNNEFNDPVYNFSYPAHWAYSGMGMAYKNINAVFTNLKLVEGKLYYGSSRLNPFPAEKFFESGDEVLVAGIRNNSSFQDCLSPLFDIINPGLPVPGIPLPSRMWAVDAAKGKEGHKGLYFIDGEGKPYSGWVISMRILRSGKRNMLDASAGSIMTMVNPIREVSPGEYNIVLDSTSKVINASVVTYSDLWKVGGKNIEYDPLLPIQIDPSKMGSEVRERKVLIAYSN